MCAVNEGIVAGPVGIIGLNTLEYSIVETNERPQRNLSFVIGPMSGGIISGSVVVIRSGQLIDFYLAARSNYRLGFSCMDYRICVVDERLVGRKKNFFFSFKIKYSFSNIYQPRWIIFGNGEFAIRLHKFLRLIREIYTRERER